MRQAPVCTTIAVIAAGFVLSMAATLPGALSYDSVIQLLEGRTAVYSGWHPPVMSWLLGLADAVWRGTALYVFVSALALFAALASLVFLARKPTWLGPLAAALCIATPQLLMYQGIVWKDVLFADAAVIGFVLLAHAAVRWRHAAARNVLLASSAVFLVLTALSRQNGGIVLFAAAAAVPLIGRRNGASRSGTWMTCAAFLAVTASATLVATSWFNTRVADPANVARQIRLLELYDLAGTLAYDSTLSLPQLEHVQPNLAALMRTDAARLYSPAKSDTLVRSARLQAALAASPTDALQSPWLALVRYHPTLYLRERLMVFRWVFLTPDIALCAPYIVGQRGPPQVLQALGMQTLVTPRDRMIDSYGKWLMHTPLFSHALFFVLGLVEFALLAIRRRDTDVVFACLLGGMTVFCASFFFLAIACDYRYLYPLDLVAIATLIYLAIDPSRHKNNAPRQGKA